MHVYSTEKTYEDSRMDESMVSTTPLEHPEFELTQTDHHNDINLSDLERITDSKIGKIDSGMRKMHRKVCCKILSVIICSQITAMFGNLNSSKTSLLPCFDAS
jgi:hypothetical protein